MDQRPLQHEKWESEEHKSWCMPAEGSRATLPRTAPCWGTLASGEHVVGQWYSWIVIKRWCPLHGMYGAMEAEYKVQRTIKRAELTAFLCFLRKVCGPIKIHVDNKAIIVGIRKGQKECFKPRAGMQICGEKLGRIT